MLITFFRSILIYIFVLIVMRLMGKREIGQITTIWTCNSNNDCRLSINSNDRYQEYQYLMELYPILGLLVMHLVISFH